MDDRFTLVTSGPQGISVKTVNRLQLAHQLTLWFKQGMSTTFHVVKL